MKIFSDVLKVILLSTTSLATLFITSRFGGKRQIAQMSMFDYINSITIGSIAAEMATNLEEWYKPFTGILVYGALAWLMHYIACKTLTARVLLSGTSIPLMENGEIHKADLARSGVDLNEFLAQCRIAGYFDLNEIQTAILETNGQISFLPKSINRPATVQDLQLSPAPASPWADLVIDGKLMPKNLKSAGKDKNWLDRQLSRQGIGRISNTFYAACDQQGNFFACRGD
jgi:uncharacterized membrane protein YcaP (DUF421 family)